MVKYVPLYYSTYNLPYTNAATLTLILFFFIYSLLYSVLIYEFNKKKNICDPKYYYGKGCRNFVANTLTADPNFKAQKAEFYNTKDKVNKRIQIDRDTIMGIDDSNADFISRSNIFSKNTIGQIQELTDIVKTMSVKYLGNLQTAITYNPDANPQFSMEQAKIPPILASLQNTINKTIVNPTYARYGDPLEKLYKSLANISPETMSTPIPE